MKVLSLIVVPGVLALAISAAKADPSPNPGDGRGSDDAERRGGADATAGDVLIRGRRASRPATHAARRVDPTRHPAPRPATPRRRRRAPPTRRPRPITPAAATTPEETNPALPPPGTPAAPTQTPTGATNMAIPPPPNGQVDRVGPGGTAAADAGRAGRGLPGAHVYSHVGVGLLVGGGFKDFTNGRLQNVTGDGGYWTARVVAGTREYVGMEAAYVGDARSITGLGLSNDSRLISNGLSGNLRVNIPIARGASLIEPFGFVGVGWSHYTVTNNNVALSDVTSSDNVLTLPYGGGLEFAYKGFMADARFTYTQTYYNNLTETIGGNLNNWGVGGQIGFEY